MILADTNIWIDHLRNGLPALAAQLEDDTLLMHPWVLGELALGSIRHRSDFILYLGCLPVLHVAPDSEVLHLIESARLYSRGIGWVDAGLLASCKAYPCRLWTKDERLAAIAAELGIGTGHDA